MRPASQNGCFHSTGSGSQWPLLGQVLTLYWTDLIDIWEVPEEARVAIVVVGGGGLMGNLGQMLFTKK